MFFSQREEHKLDTLVQQQISQNKLVLSNNPTDLSHCNIFIICINYDLGESEIEFNNLKSIFVEFLKKIRTGDYVYNPTYPPAGTIDRLISELRADFKTISILISMSSFYLLIVLRE